MTTIDERDELGEILTMARDSGVDPNAIIRHRYEAKYRSGVTTDQFIRELESGGHLAQLFAAPLREEYEAIRG